MFLWTSLVFSPASNSSDLPALLDLLEGGGCIVTADGRPLEEYRADTPFIPASTIKIATSLLALETLGPDFRFKTEFYLRDKSLVIKGYGDPFLVSESIPPIADKLLQKGVSEIESLILDQSYFAHGAQPPGTENSRNPYDAANAALAVNFNALPLVIDSSGRVTSGESQTPLLPIMHEVAQELPPGRHRVNVNGFDLGGSGATDRYTAELFIAQFRQAGIHVDSRYERGTVRDTDRLIYRHLSGKNLAELLRSSLKYSNNFMANQFFLASGAARFAPPADWPKARQAMAELLLHCCSIEPEQMYVVEGSGLSRRNRSTPNAMRGLLERFSPHRTLLPDRNGILLKSGSLQDVHNYVGYFPGTHSADPFVLFLNQPGNNRNELLHVLEQIHQRSIEQAPSGRP